MLKLWMSASSRNVSCIDEGQMIASRRLSHKDRERLGYNPYRTADLFAPTDEGYIIAQDVACQHEYIFDQPCPHCEVFNTLMPVASINRAFQGLNEMVVRCTNC